MGMFRVQVQAVGNHGCQRDVKDGGIVEGCGLPGCTDCITRTYISALKASGASVENAYITHWPESPNSILDDLCTKVREGSF